MKNEKKNIFISHIHEDDSKLANLKELLTKNGITVRDYSINSDKPNQAKNENYIKSKILTPRIEQCGTFVVYISRDTKDSKYVNWEIEHAHKIGKRIVGVWERGEKGCEIPKNLEDYYDALVGWTGDNIVKAIKGNASINENPDGSARPAVYIKRHPC